MNAIDLLKQDHKVVQDLLEQLTGTSERSFKKRTELLMKIETELAAHTTIEEEIFYPAYKQAGEKEQVQMYYEAIEEHRSVEALVLPDLKSTDPKSIQFAGRAKVLMDLLQHHIEEEEKEMFKQARKLLSKAQLDQLGERMEARKLELQGAANKAA